jgi:hypothetical protein
MDIQNETEQERQMRNNAQMFAQMRQQSGPADSQLLALFHMSDKRGQDLLLAMAAIHAQRYPKVPK